MVCAPSLRPLILYDRLSLGLLRMLASPVTSLRGSLRGEGQAIGSLLFRSCVSRVTAGCSMGLSQEIQYSQLSLLLKKIHKSLCFTWQEVCLVRYYNYSL